MFEESTERPFTSALNSENRKGFFHCANCGAKLFSSDAKFDSGSGCHHFQSHFLVLSKLKLIISLE